MKRFRYVAIGLGFPQLSSKMKDREVWSNPTPNPNYILERIGIYMYFNVSWVSKI